MRIGMRVRHPNYGDGLVSGISKTSVEIEFPDAVRTLEPVTSGVEPVEAEAAIGGLEIPLDQFISKVVESTLERINQEEAEQDPILQDLGKKWHEGSLSLKPGDPLLQAKDLPLETFFHKIVMIRNNLRVLEQKVNANSGLSEADKVELQQYITRCYGSLTTFNVLFANKEDQFSTK